MGSSTFDHPIRVVVAENSRVIREYLVSALAGNANLEVTAVCSDGGELASAMATEHPDVVVTDIRIPPSRGDEGIRIASKLRVTNPEIGVVVLSQYAEPTYALALLESGSARAYLLKERIRGEHELIDAIEAVARGDTMVDREIVEALIEARARVARSPLPTLTREQRELLAMIAEGKSTAAIADSLMLPERTVEEHTKAIFSKLDLPETETASRRTQAALVFLAEEGG